jgi:hypothetical protein
MTSSAYRRLQRFRWLLRLRWAVARGIPGGRRRACARQQRQLTAWLTGMPIGGFVVRPAANADWRAEVERRLRVAIDHLAGGDQEQRMMVGLEYLDDADNERATVWAAPPAHWRAGLVETVLDRLAATPQARMQLVITTQVAVTTYIAEQMAASASPGRP